MDTLEKLGNAGIIPVVVLEDRKDAVPCARALMAGGIRVMEITFRTEAAYDSICAVKAECPEMTVGAGTVITLAQCRQALEAGAEFIVSPGYSEEVVSYCVEHGVAVTPGCVTPTEIMAAMAHGLQVIKFFPANIYGGFSAIKALSGPFPALRFIPTGGVNQENLSDFAKSPLIHAVGGSWICSKQDIRAGNFDRITELSRQSRERLLGFEVAHVGINAPDEDTSLAVCQAMQAAFGFSLKRGNSSNFAGDGVEVMKSASRGIHGHIAVKTNSIPRAAAALAEKGIHVLPETAKYKDGRLQAIYLDCDFSGFAVHLMQK